MEELRREIAASIAQVEANLKVAEPTPEQLSRFMSNLSHRIEAILSNAGSQLGELTKNTLLSCNWDCRLHRILKNRSLEVHHCLESLRTLLERLNAWVPEVVPKDEELKDISLACNKLWELDVNRVVPNIGYAINIQNGKTSWTEGDMAKDPLFQYVHEKVFEIPTFKFFIALLDNYHSMTGETERMSSYQLKEQDMFLKAVLETPCGQYLFNYLVHLKRVPSDHTAFLRILKEVWFGLYRRKEYNDSSGFEHVFVGEVTDDKVIGMHNWIQIYFEEKKKHLDYLGYIKPKRKVQSLDKFSPSLQFITIQFTWHNHLKPESSSFIGTSPEFEFCLYSLVFFLGMEKAFVQCGPYRMLISAFRYTHKGREFIGSAYPECLPLDKDEAAIKIQSIARRRFNKIRVY